MNSHFKRFWGLCVLGLILFSQCFGFVPTVKAAGNNLFVKSDGTGTDCSQSNPCDPGQAMSNADAGDTIYFRSGIYYHLTNDPYFVITKPVTLIGGWDGGDTGEVVVDPDFYVVIVDGGNARSLFRVNDASGTGGLITITGFTFQEGYTESSGGAIYIQNGRVDIINNIFLENYATSYGGAIALEGAYEIQIVDNYFDDNQALGGGSIYISNGAASSLVELNTFNGGSAQYGTAIHNWECSMTINRNTFVDNPGNSTVMLSAVTMPSTVSNNMFIRPENDSIAVSDGSQNQIINNTIVGGRYGINVYNNTPTYVANNIISGTTSYSIYNQYGSTLTGSNNLFYGNTNDPYPLTDPVYDDPEFVNPGTDNYHIGEDSPAVDAGTTVSLDEDYDGDSRPSGGGYDIGADEIEGGYLGYLPFITQ